MQHAPKIDGAPGLRWRPRGSGFVAVWIARADLVKRGFKPKTQRLWPPSESADAELTAADEAYIRSECVRLQDEMLGFSRGGHKERAQFVPTVAGLIRAYQDDPDSPFNRKIRFESRASYLSHMRSIEADVGARALAAVKGRDLLRWYETWAEDGAHVPRAHARMRMLSMMFSFGVSILEETECARLAGIMKASRFDNARGRTEEINAAQATAIRRRAHELGLHKLALAQAFQFETILRPRDVIGLWTPRGEPGVSDIIDGPMKWLYGIDWRNVSRDLVLTHRLSKSLRGRTAIVDPKAGKVKRFDLKLYPMIMEDLAHIPEAERVGPIITDDKTGLPYDQHRYAREWRKIARAVGVPDNVQNRDSRAGGLTEGIDAMDGDLEAARHAAGHSDIRTTQLYSRSADRQTAKVAQFRAKKRDKNGLA